MTRRDGAAWDGQSRRGEEESREYNSSIDFGSDYNCDCKNGLWPAATTRLCSPSMYPPLSLSLSLSLLSLLYLLLHPFDDSMRCDGHGHCGTVEAANGEINLPFLRSR